MARKIKDGKYVSRDTKSSDDKKQERLAKIGRSRDDIVVRKQDNTSKSKPLKEKDLVVVDGQKASPAAAEALKRKAAQEQVAKNQKYLEQKKAQSKPQPVPGQFTPANQSMNPNYSQQRQRIQNQKELQEQKKTLSAIQRETKVFTTLVSGARSLDPVSQQQRRQRFDEGLTAFNARTKEFEASAQRAQQRAEFITGGKPFEERGYFGKASVIALTPLTGPLLAGGAIAQSVEKTDLALQASFISGNKVANEFSTAAKSEEFRSTFDITKPEGFVTYGTAGVGALLPAVARARVRPNAKPTTSQQRASIKKGKTETTSLFSDRPEPRISESPKKPTIKQRIIEKSRQARGLDPQQRSLDEVLPKDKPKPKLKRLAEEANQLEASGFLDEQGRPAGKRYNEIKSQLEKAEVKAENTFNKNFEKNINRIQKGRPPQKPPRKSIWKDKRASTRRGRNRAREVLLDEQLVKPSRPSVRSRPQTRVRARAQYGVGLKPPINRTALAAGLSVGVRIGDAIASEQQQGALTGQEQGISPVQDSARLPRQKTGTNQISGAIAIASSVIINNPLSFSESNSKKQNEGKRRRSGEGELGGGILGSSRNSNNKGKRIATYTPDLTSLVFGRKSKGRSKGALWKLGLTARPV